MKKWDYKKIIEGIKEGDYYAFEALYMLYFGRFISFTERIIHDREAAKDLVQEQFMKIWLLRNHLDENKSIRNYLYVLTKRAILNYLRDLKKTERIDESKAGELGDLKAGEEEFRYDLDKIGDSKLYKFVVSGDHMRLNRWLEL